MTPQENSPASTRETILAQLTADLGDHYFWLPRLFARAGGWRWIVPWPLLMPFNRSKLSTSKQHGSAWLTVVITLAVSAGPDRLRTLGDQYGADLSKTLFAGSFLVITMLSLSVAVPGQAIMRLVLGKNPLFVAQFVSPTLWAFIWGIVAGTCMMLYASLAPGLKMPVSVLSLYAFAMQVNAVLYTMRMYSFGLLLTARESAPEGSGKKG